MKYEVPLSCTWNANIVRLSNIPKYNLYYYIAKAITITDKSISLEFS
jgi:hypothetical protein